MAEILDIIVISLLVIAIVYGIILNRKIVLLQQSKQELANLFKSFDDTILKAQIGIDDLKDVSTEVSTLLNQKMDKAYLLLDDLSFLSEKITKLNNEMDDKVKKTQQQVVSSFEKQRFDNSKNVSLKPTDVTALRQSSVINSPSLPSKNNIKPFVNNKKAVALESLLEKISERRITNAEPLTQKSNKNTLQKELDEEQTVANMLKAMGYGDS
jgi:hypothetical protein